MNATSGPEEEVALVRAVQGDAPVLLNLLELYIHDLSEFFPIQVGADGRFGYDRLAQCWQEPERRAAYFIRIGARLAGFALMTRGSPQTDDPSDLDVAEFFVLRSFRRSQVGRRAAFMLWDRTEGHWIVRVAGNNQRALAFWRTIISDYSASPLSERTVEVPGRVWHVLDFHTR